jgi:peptidoglycan-associated lipoprotein
MKRLLLVVLAGIVATTVVACGGKKAEPATTPTPQPNADSLAAAEKARKDSMDAADRAREEADRLAQQRIADSLAALGHTAEAVRAMLATMIHFDYDKSNIRSGDASVLDQKIGILQANPDARIRISGHCDERGSDEYNLALGNRRATASKQYLVSHGIDAGRVETISYGEERPLDPGHNEEAWAKNRRAEFDVVSGGDALHQP